MGYLLLKFPANYSGFAAFGMAALGMLLGSLALPARPRSVEDLAMTSFWITLWAACRIVAFNL